MKKSGSAERKGSLKDGGGTISTGTGVSMAPTTSRVITAPIPAPLTVTGTAARA